MHFLTKSTVLVSNTILYEARTTFNTYLSNMKLQKLLYFCFGRCLVKTQKKIIDEDFEAWAYGCVVPSLYHEYKQYKRGSYIKHYIPTNDNNIEIIDKDNNGEIYDTIQCTLTDLVYKKSFELSDLNHKVGGAWWKTKEKNEKKVSINDIKEEFKSE